MLPAQESQQIGKGHLTRLWEHSASAAVKDNELAEHEGAQTMACWTEADVSRVIEQIVQLIWMFCSSKLYYDFLFKIKQQQGTSADKIAKFKKLLSMKFGPARGPAVFEVVCLNLCFKFKIRE